jgi:two-component system CheB/CheR fusion protein
MTRFFYDPEALNVLAARALAPLAQHKEDDAVIRVWVPCCGTGEEPYSIAMLLLEQLEMTHKSSGVQIIASDVNADALAVARKGFYPDSISADVSPGRLSHFFTKVDAHTYQVKNTLREPTLFAVHHLLTDPPYSKLDIISCRDLIPLEADVLKKMLTLFHFILKEGGFLFLGSSHTIRGLIGLFEPVSKKRRLYRRIGPSRPERVSYPIVAKAEAIEIERRLPKECGFQSMNISKMAQRLLMEQFVPASVIINRKYEICYFFGPCSHYLEFPNGEPTRDLMQMVPDELQTKLQGAIHRTILSDKSMVVTYLRLKRNGSHHRVRVTVWPVLVPTPAEELLLITFEEDIFSEQPSDSSSSSAQMDAGSEFKNRQLEHELMVTREQLQSTIKDLACSNEKLKTFNEEMMSMNQELQSTNEELGTSKEELQALNEELNTVVDLLRDKIEELETANNDISNLLNCTDMATVFLDREFRIKLFTPTAAKLFHLICSDVGRSLGDIKLRFNDPLLFDDAQHTLHHQVPHEREVSSTEGEWWLRRIVPYRTQDNRVEGLAIIFMDITERKMAVDEVVLRLASIVENSLDAIFSKNLDGIIQTWNHGAERLYGYMAEEIIGQSVRMLVPADRGEEWASIMARLRGGESVEQLETEGIRKDGQRIPVVLTISPLRDSNGKVVNVSTIARDIRERKRAEQNLRESEERLRAILTTATDGILTINQIGIIQSANPAAERMFGYMAAEMIGQNVKMLMPSPYRDEHDGYLERYLRTGNRHIIGIGREVQARRKDDSVFPMELAVSEIKDLKLFAGIVRDITQRKELEREVVEIASSEQRRIGQDLHDTVGQELTALNLLAKDLAEKFQSDAVKASLMIEQMIQGLHRSQQELRAVLRGLLPVAVDNEGLMVALDDLADRVLRECRVSCVFDCPTPVSVADNLTATHLYLIASEAVNNAVKHAHAKKIRITLKVEGGLVLRVQDDGIGIPPRPAENRVSGFRIMLNRAQIIGAKLTIEPAKPTGTLVSCMLARKNNEPQRSQDESSRPNR